MSTRKHPRRRRGRKKKQTPPVETTTHSSLGPLVLTVPPVSTPPTATLSLSTVRARLQTLNARRQG